MNLRLVDTDAFSLMFKADSRGSVYSQLLRDSRACLSFMTVAELRLWTLQRNWGKRRMTELENAIGRCVLLSPDLRTMHEWANLTAVRAQTGQPISCADAWIAATALRHGLPLITHNARDFANIPGLTVLTAPEE